MLREAGAEEEEILKILSRYTGRTEEALKELMQEAVTKAMKEDAAIHEAAGQTVPDFRDSQALRDKLTAGYLMTRNTMRNLTGTTAHTATGQFEAALDRAWMQVSSGAFSYQQAVLGAVNDLARQGIQAIRYPSGHTDTIETAVRRAVVTGVNQTALRCQEALSDELGCDLVEVTAHEGARPSHALWQGKVYSRSGESKKYPKLADATGYGTGEGLGGWNCRHSFHPYYEGTARTWTDEQLEKLDQDTVTYNGKTLTRYEAGQVQRGIERNLRRWKREYSALEAAGADTGPAAAKIQAWNARQKDFLRQTGLKRQGSREEVAGWTGGHARRAWEKADPRSGEKKLEKFDRDAIINKKLRDQILDIWNESDNTFEYEAIEKALESSSVGRAASKYIQDNGIIITMDYSLDSDGLAGEVIGKDIQVYAAEHRTVEEVSETILHETCHLMYKWDKTQEDEVNCRLMEIFHRKGDITESDIRKTVRFVKEYYSEYLEGELYGYV